jgi:hypothetical protein
VCLTIGAGLVVAAISLSRSRLRGLFGEVGKGSFTWRLARYEQFMAEAARRPVLGHGRADWSPMPDGTFIDPAAMGLWFHTFGTFGVVGALATAGVLICPLVLLVAGRHGPRRDTDRSVIVTCAVVVAMGLGDGLMNSTLVLPLLAISGGVIGLARQTDVRTDRGSP